eukprot:gene12121-5612_t
MTEVLCNVCNENAATKFCGECKVNIQCDDCSEFFHKKKSNQGHDVKDYSEDFVKSFNEKKEPEESEPVKTPEVAPNPTEETEEENLKLYCEECRQLVCMICLTGEHNGHVCKSLNDAVNPLALELMEEIKIFDNKTKYYKNILDKVETSSQKITKEKEERIAMTKKTFEDLRALLDEKEKEIYEHITTTEEPKVTKLEIQGKQLKKSMEVLSSHVESAKKVDELKENSDPYDFITKSLVKCQEMKYFEFETHEEEPVCLSGDYRELDVRSVTESIKKVELSPPIDWQKSMLAPQSKFVAADKKTGFLVYLNNSEGNPITLEDRYELSAKIVSETPEGFVSFLEFRKSSKPGRIHFTFLADLPGDYKVKISWKGHEFKGSPYDFCVRPNFGQPIDLQILPTQAAHFYVKNEEFCFANKKSVTTYDITGKKKNTYNLPIKAAYIASDSSGNYYVSDGEKKWYKYDSDFNELKQWEYPFLLKGETVVAISASQVDSDEYFYGMTSAGKILKCLNDETKGLYKTCFQIPDYSPEFVGNFIVFDDLFIVSDKTIKVYDSKGVLRQQMTEFTEGAVFAVVYDQLYACGMNSKVWSTLFLAPDWEKQKVKKKKLPRGELIDGNERGLQRPNSLSRMSIFSLKSPRIVNQSIEELDSISKIKVQAILKDDKINSICTTPSGEYFITGGTTIKVWDYDHCGQVETTIDTPANIVITDGTYIIATYKKIVQIYDLLMGEKVRDFDVEEEISAMALSADGKKIVCGMKNGKIWYYQLENPSICKNLGKHGDCINCLILSQDGKFIFSGSTDTNLKIWGYEKGDLHTLKGHADAVTSLYLSDETHTLVSGSADGSIRIWTTEPLKCVKILSKAHKNEIQSLHVTPNGQFIVSTSYKTGVVKIHKIDTGSERLSASLPKKEINHCCAIDGGNGKFILTGTDLGVALWQNVKFTSMEDEKKVINLSNKSPSWKSLKK